MRAKGATARRNGPRAAAALALCAVALGGPSAYGYDAAREASNYSKTGERTEHDQLSGSYQLEVLARGLDNMLDLIVRDARERDRLSATLCASGFNGCAGDVRVYDWAERRMGVQLPVVYVNRNGAHIEGHLWVSRRTLRGEERAPGVIIETGSVQAPERLYWWAAQVLAAHGYVAMTFDVQGQGRSDSFGSGEEMFGGVPAQDAGHFVEDLQDAIRFFRSTKGSPYEPPSEEGARKQSAEVKARDADAFNPLHGLVDRGRLGIVGHSLGAFSVSMVQGLNRPVDALVAWDNLGIGSDTPIAEGLEIRPRVPALGMSADYFLTPTPYGSDPEPQEKNAGFEEWRAAGVDVMQLNIRGGTHYEWSYISNPFFPATLRGIDMAAWYTTAWLDKYVRLDPTADRRLLTERWRDDPLEAGVDSEGDGNMFSFYFPSRAWLSRTRPDGSSGRRVVCDDLRAGCAFLHQNDGIAQIPPYSFLEDRGG